MTYVLPKLPYGYEDLEPVIDKRIMELHHSKHHKSYVDGANKALDLLEKAKKGEEINIRSVLRDYSFNLNGHILHSIFWEIMEPPSENNTPGGDIGDAIEKEFGSFETFKKLFKDAAVKVEGVGWAVLYTDTHDNLHLAQIEKHNLMHLSGLTPILVIDVWEHAYYLQYENRRGEYVENWFKVINWDKVEELFKKKKIEIPKE